MMRPSLSDFQSDSATTKPSLAGTLHILASSRAQMAQGATRTKALKQAVAQGRVKDAMTQSIATTAAYSGALGSFVVGLPLDAAVGTQRAGSEYYRGALPALPAPLSMARGALDVGLAGVAVGLGSGALLLTSGAAGGALGALMGLVVATCKWACQPAHRRPAASAIMNTSTTAGIMSGLFAATVPVALASIALAAARIVTGFTKLIAVIAMSVVGALLGTVLALPAGAAALIHQIASRRPLARQAYRAPAPVRPDARVHFPLPVTPVSSAASTSTSSSVRFASLTSSTSSSSRRSHPAREHDRYRRLRARLQSAADGARLHRVLRRAHPAAPPAYTNDRPPTYEW